MSQSVMISGAHLDSLTWEPLCHSPGNCNHSYSADATSSSQPHTPNMGLFLSFSSGFPAAISALSLPSSLFLLSHSLYTFISFPHSQPNNLNLISLLIALLPLWTSPFHLHLPAVADCQCLRVICGHFSFIILSKTGMALAQGDWVSVKHQDLIEFVPKWVMQGTLLIQTWGPIRLGG